MSCKVNSWSDGSLFETIEKCNEMLCAYPLSVAALMVMMTLQRYTHPNDDVWGSAFRRILSALCEDHIQWIGLLGLKSLLYFMHSFTPR